MAIAMIVDAVNRTFTDTFIEDSSINGYLDLMVSVSGEGKLAHMC